MKNKQTVKKEPNFEFMFQINEGIVLAVTMKEAKNLHRALGKHIENDKKQRAKRKASRSAKSGRFVTKSQAKKNPARTVNETF